MRAAWLLFGALLAQEPQVREVRDLPYWEGAEADPKRNRVDLYLPTGSKNFPILMYIHGGGWMTGDRTQGSELGRRFAESGVGFAAVGYRLSPAVKHPAHVQDCARAFAWLSAHAAEYGGDPKRLFISGYSAGGHLAALLAMDPSYLREEKVPEGAIKGAIPISGIYSIPALPADTKGPQSMFPFCFGSDPEVCKAASPITHVAQLSVPILVMTETENADEIRRETWRFQSVAENAGAKSLRFVNAEHRSHNNIVEKMAGMNPEPSRTALMEFIQEQCRKLDASK